MTRALLARGHTVIACDDLSIGTWRDTRDRLIWDAIDVADPGLARRLDHHAPAAVVHCAAHPGGRSNDEPSADVRVNTLGSMQVFEWCARNTVPVVYLSSSAVYGEQPATPIVESAPLGPGTVYAVCKVACEGFLRVLQGAYGLQWTALRLFATYGPGHRPGTSQGIVNVLITQLLAGNRVVVRGSLGRVRDLVYVDDAAEAIVACLFEPRARHRILNVGTGDATTVGDVIARLGALLGRRHTELELVEEPGTAGDPAYSVADTRAFAAATGVVPRIRLDDGLARLVAARTGH